MRHDTHTSTHTIIDADPWLTLRDGGAYAQVDPATLRREIQRGHLRHARVGGRKCIRLRRSWIDQWLESSSTSVEGSPSSGTRPVYVERCAS